jgi:hypothetical protein
MRKGKALSTMPMAMFTKASGTTIKQTEKEYIKTSKEHVTKVLGKQISKTVTVLRRGPRDLSTKETTNKDARKAMASTPGQIQPPTMAIGKTTKLMVTAFICGLMAASTTAPGPTMICRGTEFTFTRMVCAMTANT